jgi:hypothetical protein
MSYIRFEKDEIVIKSSYDKINKFMNVLSLNNVYKLNEKFNNELWNIYHDIEKQQPNDESLWNSHISIHPKKSQHLKFISVPENNIYSDENNLDIIEDRDTLILKIHEAKEKLKIINSATILNNETKINETERVIIYTDQLKKSYYNNKNNLVKALNWFYENYQCIDSEDLENSNLANAHRLVFAYKINDLTIDYYGTTPQMIVEDGELYLKQFYTLTLSIKNNISLQSFKYLIPFLESHEIYNRILRIEFNYDEQFEGIIFKIVLINGGKMDPYVVIHKIKNDVLVFNADNLESGNCIIDFSTDF